MYHGDYIYIYIVAYNGLFSGQMMDYLVDYNANLKVVYSSNPWWWLASRVGQVVPR